MAMSFPGKAVLPSLFCGFIGLALAACGSETKEVVAPSCESSQKAVTTASFSELYTNVFEPQCGACHGSGTNTGAQGGPDMRTAATFYDGLVGKKGTDYSDWDTYQKNREGCLAYDFIKAGSASESVVTAVLDNSVTLPNCTIKYHRDAPQSVCITAGNLSKLKEWMNAGASR